MPINPFERKVSLRRPHGNGDLDIIWAMYTHRKANVIEALWPLIDVQNCNLLNGPRRCESLTADPGVGSSITACFQTFVEIDREIISTVILLSSAESFKKDCCQLQA